MANEEVIELEKKAKVLVNLRDPQVLITKYAFPSKILEYLSVGGAVVSTVLEGIPSEYYQFLIAVSDPSVIEIQKSIDYVLDLSYEDYCYLCFSGQQWVIQNKTASVQADKIINFVFE